MKRLLCLILAAILLFSLTACEKDQEPSLNGGENAGENAGSNEENGNGSGENNETPNDKENPDKNPDSDTGTGGEETPDNNPEPATKTVYYWTEEKHNGFPVYTRTYDEKGNLLTDTYASSDGYGGYSYTYTYDENGNCLSEYSTDVQGCSTSITYTYDENGRLLTEINATRDGYSSHQSTIQYFYNASGQLEKSVETEPDSDVQVEILYTCDEGGRVLKEETHFVYPDQRLKMYTNEYSYDAMGNKLSECFYNRDELCSKTTWTYDEAGRLTGEFLHNDSYTVYAYDEAGHLVEKTEGRIVNEVSKPSYTLYYQYGENGHLSQRYELDGQGNKYHITEYTCDESGNVLQERHYTNADGSLSLQKDYTYIAIEVPNK